MGKLFIDHGSRPTTAIGTPRYDEAVTRLFAAIPQGDNDLKTIEELCKVINVGTAHNRHEYSPLTFAIFHKQSKTVELLLQHGANATQPDLDDRSPIEMARDILRNHNCEAMRNVVTYLESTISRRNAMSR
jgi:hypothetical protein